MVRDLHRADSAATLVCYHFVEMPIVAVRRRFGSSAPAQAIPRVSPGADSVVDYASIVSRETSAAPAVMVPAPTKLVEGSFS